MILDHVDGLCLEEGLVSKKMNELQCTRYLSEGLGYLFGQVAHIECEIQQHADNYLLAGMPEEVRESFSGKNITGFCTANSPGMRNLPWGLITCAFHWYAVSVCNYVRLVGWLANESGADAHQKALEYLTNVIPSVKKWRDKVAAHFAIACPKPSDTDATLLASVLFPVAFEDGVFVANPWDVNIRSGGKASNTRAAGLERWSLTKVHTRLAKRYWPHQLDENNGLATAKE